MSEWVYGVGVAGAFVLGGCVDVTVGITCDFVCMPEPSRKMSTIVAHVCSVRTTMRLLTFHSSVMVCRCSSYSIDIVEMNCRDERREQFVVCRDVESDVCVELNLTECRSDIE